MTRTRAGAVAAAFDLALSLTPAASASGTDGPWPDRTKRVSLAHDGAQGNDSSHTAHLSLDGRHVAFESRGTTLVPGDTNGASDVFTRDMGPPVGVGHLTGIPEPAGARGAGWTRFLGALPVESSASPASPLHPQAGLDSSGARAVYRPDVGDVLVRLDLGRLPSVSGVAGTPGVVYGAGFEVGGVAYEARAVKPVTEVASGWPRIDLFRCDDACEQVSGLDGSYGQAGADVRFSIPARVVQIAAVADDAPDPETFDTQIGTPGDVFEAFVADNGLDAYDVVARGCLGSECGLIVRTQGPRGP